MRAGSAGCPGRASGAGQANRTLWADGARISRRTGGTGGALLRQQRPIARAVRYIRIRLMADVFRFQENVDVVSKLTGIIPETLKELMNRTS